MPSTPMTMQEALIVSSKLFKKKRVRKYEGGWRKESKRRNLGNFAQDTVYACIELSRNKLKTFLKVILIKYS